MRRILGFLFFTIVTLGITVCHNGVSSSTPENSKVVEIDKSPDALLSDNVVDADEACKEWQRLYGLLSDKDKLVLQKDGVVSGYRDDKYNDGYYVLTPDLVADCHRRVVIGELIRKLIVERDTVTDKEFARRNSKEFVKVIRHIWNSEPFSHDGTVEEKYTLLTYGGIKDADIAPFIGELLKTEGITGIHGGLESTLINRPLKSLKPIVTELLRNAEKEQNVPQQVYFLIVLYQIAPQPVILSKLIEMTENSKLSDKTKKELKNIINKFKSSIPIDYRDIEKLEMPLVVFDDEEN